MNRWSYAIVLCLVVNGCVSSAPDRQLSEPVVETVPLISRVFANERLLRVLLPPGYHDTANRRRSYPVLYLNDGVSAFRNTGVNLPESIGRAWSEGRLPPLIIVGIDNGGSSKTSTNPGIERAREYLPYPDVGFAPNHLYDPDPAEPLGQLYPAFLADEVMALIQSRYRVRRGAANTAIGGFSYGGVAALYAVMNRPGVFGKLLLESTPLWIGVEKRLMSDAGTVTNWPLTISLGVGTKETKDEAVNVEGRRDLLALEAIIRTRSPRSEVRVFLEEGAEHGSAAWRRRVPAAIEFLFRQHRH